MKYFCACLTVGLAVLLVGADSPRPEWTTDVDKMKFPEAPAVGKVQGADFVVDKVKLEATGALTLQQGTEIIPDAAVIIFLPIKPGQSVEGTSYEFSAAKVEGEKRPPIHVKRRPSPKELPQGTAFADGYAMRLEFGKEKDGKVPGKVYICLPDEGKSFVAGTFILELK
jgi:hypothetical protein